MNPKCCFTENDRKLLKLNALALGSLDFPGAINTVVTEESVNIAAEFPTEKTEGMLAETETLINNFIQFKLWQAQLYLITKALSNKRNYSQEKSFVGTPTINLYFQELIEDVEPGYPPIASTISFRLIDKTYDQQKYPHLDLITENDITQLAQQIFNIFAQPQPYALYHFLKMLLHCLVIGFRL